MKLRLVAGVYAASPTPFSPDHRINTSLLIHHCKWLLTQGCKGICLAGTTGEANSLSLIERMSMLEEVLTAGVDPSRVLVGTGCCSLSDTTELTRHALSLGVAGILVLPPFFYKPVTHDGLKSYFSGLIEAVARDSPGLYLYHIPKLSGIPFSKELIHDLLESYPQTIVGLKDSGNDSKHIQSMIREFPELDIFCGSERFLTDTLIEGGKGCISATVNLTASIANRIFENFSNGVSDTEQEVLDQIRGSFEKFPLIAALKFALSTMGSGDWHRLRAPLVGLNEEEIRKLKPLLANVNSFLMKSRPI